MKGQGVIGILVLAVWTPIIGRILLGRLPHLQRIGTGIFRSLLSGRAAMTVAGRSESNERSKR